MSPFEYRRIIKALETFGGGFFQSLIPSLKKADPINREILVEAFQKMEGSNKYLPGGTHYDGVTPEFGPSDLDMLHKHTMQYFGLDK